ncbi:helix-turn-helix domain-containing protein [Kordia sp. YSTF-M3]|uniref:Helix-turn-helix domain-containing protein n=1 Tax=Kordia aestuariivivens TaxID=2759037 RepID=A0ABR7Q8U4_9FLAO|nr:helix-turn-helix transcriptional regulator [Kordia aestuariivivens]MBC8754918.1 helix-turn-helix domain-containing protein [Kordia aestuariivivens]
MKLLPVYNISQFKEDKPSKHLYCNRFEEHLRTHPFIEKPHIHDFHLVVLFTKGTGTHIVDFNTYEINAGSVFVLQPGQMHHWNLSKDIDGFILFHSKEFYNVHFRHKQINDYPFYYSTYNTPKLRLNAPQTQTITSFFEMILAEYTSRKLFNEHSILNLLDLIYIELSRHYITPTQLQVKRYHTILRSFEELLEQFYKYEKKPSFYASRLNITLKHLNRICKETLQKTATTVITDRIILEAKRLLLTPELAVNEIANRLGFEDYSYFSRLFKQKTQRTPSSFRSSAY